MSQINISHLTFAYEGSYDNIFADVSFQIDTDWKLGFCGRNGRGKTTFLKLLTGQYEYEGTITAGVEFEYFPYAVADPSLNTLDILSAAAPDVLPWQFQKEFAQLDLDENVLYRPFSTLSNGEQTKALLAGLFLRKNNFLLIDEPTNHLDMAARETVAQYLDGKTGFILVSHDRAFLDACVNYILSINKANIEIQKGNFSSWFMNKQLQDNYETAKNYELKKEIKRLTVTAREKADWSDRIEATKIGTHQADRGYIGHLAAKMMKKSKAIEHRTECEIEEKSKLMKNIESSEPLKIHPLAYHAQRLVTLENVTVAYDKTEVFRGISLSLSQGDRLALLGRNGSGKSSLLKLVCGEDVPHSGTVTVASGLIISYVPQDTSFLTGSLDAYAAEQGIDVTLFKTILRKLDFARVQFEKDMRDFSAGQKKKALIARSLCQHAHLYVWDEPLNYIDVLSRVQIEELILSYKPTLLFTEHDRAFCNNIATQVISINH